MKLCSDAQASPLVTNPTRLVNRIQGVSCGPTDNVIQELQPQQDADRGKARAGANAANIES